VLYLYFYMYRVKEGRYFNLSTHSICPSAVIVLFLCVSNEKTLVYSLDSTCNRYHDEFSLSVPFMIGFLMKKNLKMKGHQLILTRFVCKERYIYYT
jgi:hypothetical protein